MQIKTLYLQHSSLVSINAESIMSSIQKENVTVLLKLKFKKTNETSDHRTTEYYKYFYVMKLVMCYARVTVTSIKYGIF
jgi:hypothetical protein